MKFELIDRIEYNNNLESLISKSKIFLSPNLKYEIKEIYAGNYLRGDNHSHIELINIKEESVLWKLRNGIVARELKKNPWTINSDFFYLDIIEKGGKVIFYDLKNDKYEVAYYDSNRLNSIDFIPSNICGAIVLTYPYHSEIGKDWKYYFHNPLSNNLILINDIIKSNKPIRPFDSNIEDTIIVLDESEVYIVNIKDCAIVERSSLPVKLDKEVIHWNHGFVVGNEIFLNLFPNRDNQEGNKYRFKL